MGKANPKADFYFNGSEKWQKEMKKLRAIALGCGLTEELKWGCPSYTLGKSNIVLIHEFKEYCAYLFFKGALMKDPKRILIQQTRNVQAARQIRFTGVREITGMASILKAYIKQAIEVDESGLKVEMKKTADFGMPAEFKAKLKDVPGLKSAFESLTPGRQRAYLLFFSSAKQSATRESRIGKNLDRILDGIGLDD
jgi:uncharacterized protein YdeI (YjbR/CyaY-like superfamily)